MSQFTTDLRTAIYRIGQMFPGYDEILVQVLFALATEEHVLWVSKPGRAKSQVSNAVFGLFPDATKFSTQLTKDMMPDQLFGNVIPDILMTTGQEVRNLKGGIAAVQFARLEELFDGSDILVRALLTVLNERMYESKDQTVVAPLHTAIATTNFMRQREVTEAVMDRIMCKAWLNGVSDLTDCMRAGDNYIGYAGKVPKLPVLKYEELKQLSDLVQSPDGIELTPAMRMLHVLLLHEFQRRRIEVATTAWHTANADAAEEPTAQELGVPEITPRTLVRAYDFSRAAAALNDRISVQASDQRALAYGIVTIGDNSGDEVLWHALCDEWLNFSSREMDAFERVADIATAVGTLKSEKAQTTDVEMMIGGKLVTATALGLQDMLDSIRKVRHPALTQAFDQLDVEIGGLTTNKPSGFDLVKGW